MNETGEERPNRRERAFLLAARPMSLYWVMLAVILVAGLVDTALTGRINWEALFAALAITGLTVFVARAKGVPAWPWEKPRSKD